MQKTSPKEYSVQSTEKLWDVIHDLKPKHVIFDIFDTLVHRRVHPEDVKKLAAHRLYSSLLSLQLPSWKILYQYRNELERDLCTENVNAGKDMEFSFPSFCRKFFNFLIAKGYQVDRYMPVEKFISLLIDIELSVERTVQYTDNNVKECIIRLKREGVNVTFMSDFYLPETAIADLLVWHGMENSYDSLMVSSDFLETKRSGKLYGRMLAESVSSPNSMVMVGDNRDVDTTMAIKFGLNAIWIDRTVQQKKYQSFANSFADKKLMFAKLDKLFRKEAVFPEFSLSLYGFVEKLHRKLVADGVRDVFFLSREGQPLKRMFDSYQKSINVRGDLFIRSHYFLASRKSTFLPGLEDLEKEKFQTLFRQYRKISLKDFLCSIGLGRYLDMFAEELEIDPNLKEDDFPTGTLFARLVSNKVFMEKYEAGRKQQKRNFLKYLQSFDVDLIDKEIALVDVGWKGTIQDNISKILGKEYRVRGYYLGMLAAGNSGEYNQKDGLLFSCLGGASKGFFVYRDNTALFEVILAADHGSASYYDDEQNGVMEDFTKDAPLYNNIIRPLLQEQEERFKQICDIVATFPVDTVSFDSYVVKKHARMVFFPAKEELNWFSSIYHRENFGLFEDSEFTKEKELNIKQRCSAMYQLLTAPRSYLMDTFWPALKLKESGLGFAVRPYNAYRMFRLFIKKEI